MARADVPTVTVVMPALNAENTIGAAITGVLTQSHRAVEIIVVDDGSTDRTSALCRAFGDRIRYIRTDNEGSSAARNRGIAEATGQFIAFCDADDMLLPPYLTANLNAYAAAGGGRRIVMNDALLLTSTGLAHGRRLIGPKFPRREHQRLAMLQKNFVPILAVFPRSLLVEVPQFDTTLEYCEDWEFWIRAVLSGWEVIYQRTPHALYRWTPNAKSTHPERHEAENVIMRRVWEKFGDRLNSEEQRFMRIRLTTPPPRQLDLEGTNAVRRGDWQTARSAFATLATLSSEDRRMRVRALAIAHAPALARLWRLRLRRMDESIGRTMEDNR